MAFASSVRWGPGDRLDQRLDRFDRLFFGFSQTIKAYPKRLQGRLASANLACLPTLRLRIFHERLRLMLISSDPMAYNHRYTNR